MGSYLLAKRDNDKTPQVLSMRGFADKDPLAALVNTALDVATVSRSNKPFYHGILNPREGEALTMAPEQWEEAANIMEKYLKFEGLPRLIVLHEKAGRFHAHVVWSRYDHNAGRLRSDSYNFYKQNSARSEIEVLFGHQRTRAKRDRTREPGHKELLTQLWEQSEDAADFIAQAQGAGYEIGQGLDRRPYRVITPEGVSLDLVRTLDGYRKSDVQARFKGYGLQTEAQALKANQERLQAHQHTAQQDRRAQLLNDFMNNTISPANDNEPDIFQQLMQQQNNQSQKRAQGLDY